MNLFVFFLFTVGFIGLTKKAFACTSFGIGKKATADGAVMVSHSVDGWYDHRLRFIEGQKFETPTNAEIFGDLCTDTRVELPVKKLGEIPQVDSTYGYFHIGYPFLNETGLTIGEHTWVGREEIISPKGLFYIANLQILGLQRSRTAKECIQVMTSLAEEWGYRDVGECLIVGDEQEVWVLEICGAGKDWEKGCGRPGAYWIARRLPDDCFFVGANRSRMGEIDFTVSEDTQLVGKGLREFAASLNLWHQGEPFNFSKIFDPHKEGATYYASRREWRVLNLLAPSQKFEPADDSVAYPQFVTPDQPITLETMWSLYSDHYENTDFDLTKGLAAGPFHNPTRWSQEQDKLPQEMKGLDWERPIAIFRCSYSFVAQIRDHVPEPIKTCLWLGLDAQDTTVYAPLYNGARDIPQSYMESDQTHFSINSTWWAFNLVRNWACLRWDAMYQEISTKKALLERGFRAAQPYFEDSVKQAFQSDPELANSMVSDYCYDKMSSLHRHWWKFAQHLISRYHNGMQLTPEGARANPGYPAGWLTRVDFGSHISKRSTEISSDLPW